MLSGYLYDIYMIFKVLFYIELLGILNDRDQVLNSINNTLIMGSSSSVSKVDDAKSGGPWLESHNKPKT